MRNIGVITYLEERGDKKSNKILKLVSGFGKSFNRNLYRDAFEEVRIDEELSIYLISIPYTLNEIINFKYLGVKKISSAILKICRQNNIEKCYLPQNTPDNLYLKDCIRNPFSGDFIYTALLVDILKEITERKRRDIRNLDMVVVHGDSFNMLYYFIELLSPLVKFITIITSEKDAIEKKTEDILEETGLSVRITSDLKSGLRNADIIINLGELDSVIINSIEGREVTVINYGKILCNSPLSGNLIIDGVNIGLTSGIKGILSKNAVNFYSDNEIAEIIITHKLNIEAKVFTDSTDYNIMNKVYKQFRNYEYIITGYMYI